MTRSLYIRALLVALCGLPILAPAASAGGFKG